MANKGTKRNTHSRKLLYFIQPAFSFISILFKLIQIIKRAEGAKCEEVNWHSV